MEDKLTRRDFLINSGLAISAAWGASSCATIPERQSEMEHPELWPENVDNISVYEHRLDLGDSLLEVTYRYEAKDGQIYVIGDRGGRGDSYDVRRGDFKDLKYEDEDFFPVLNYLNRKRTMANSKMPGEARSIEVSRSRH
jgi:hypothetical protein